LPPTKALVASDPALNRAFCSGLRRGVTAFTPAWNRLTMTAISVPYKT
jgi:hypothetical protein